MPIIFAVTIGAGQQAGAAASQSAASDWAAVRGMADIQYAPLPRIAPPQARTPDWLRALGELLEALFAPVGRWLGMSWPVFQYVLIGLGILLVLFLAWRVLGPLVSARAARGDAQPDAPWVPDRGEAAALLTDADRLAAQGRFDEATHLLLRRSVQQIRAARPDWLHPASTAREIAAMPALPEPGRIAFGAIARRVERSRFALRALDAQDWAAAREAYAAFAQVRLSA